MISDIVRKKIVSHLLDVDQIEFKNDPLSGYQIDQEFEDINHFGLYLHIPFCNRICPYCPYNKEIYSEEASDNYKKALFKEIDAYAAIVGNKPVTSFYIGGGTPTTMLNDGLEEIIDHIYKRFNIHCGIHLESHPNHLTRENLTQIKDLGVDYLSVGVEALQDHHLKTIKRNYTVEEAKRALRNAMEMNFKCVNMDFMFDLPGQTPKEIEDAAEQMLALDVDQVATYPLFNFEYAHINNDYIKKRKAVPTMLRRRKLLKILEDHFYEKDFYRSSVWAFTRKGVEKYCSVTVPRYLGLGASGSSYLNNIFYVNTFKVKDYVSTIQKGDLPIALSIQLSKQMQMWGWLYWRIYETAFNTNEFNDRFGVDFRAKFGNYIQMLKPLGFVKQKGDHIRLTDKGTYWIHAFEDYFSINYINKLWGNMRKEAWPEKIMV